MEWAPEATPQTEEQVRRSPRCPEVIEAAIERGITSIVHFTRARPGLVGILARSAVMARRDLPVEVQLRHVYEENAVDRSRDQPWHGYVNLSVTTINKRFFKFSQREHPHEEWVILEFGPEILGEPGVVFCTTNNAYPVVHRSAELRGFNQMFAQVVPWGYQGSASTRTAQQRNQTTDPQAEILYPFALSLDYLHTITVGDGATHDTVAGTLFNLRSELPREPDIVLTPEAFR
jgi:hypothetical protein